MWLSLRVSSPFLSCGSDCFATTVSSWNRGIYTTVCIFLNIYFVENKDRYLIVSSHKLNGLPPSWSISYCLYRSDRWVLFFFFTTNSVLCLFVFTEAFMFGTRMLSNTLDSQREDSRAVDEDGGGVQFLEGDSRVPHTDS